MRLSYILKWFPKASETFVLDELLAHQKAGIPLTIFSLLHSPDNMHQDYVSDLRVPIHYAPEGTLEQKADWIASLCTGSTTSTLSSRQAQPRRLISYPRKLAFLTPSQLTPETFIIKRLAQDLAHKLGRARFCITVSEYNHTYLRA